MMKFRCLLVFLVPVSLAWPAAAQENVIISEFMPANERTLADEDGAFPDWIEMLNAGSAPVNLLGWHLTDDASAPGKWTFPSVTLALLNGLARNLVFRTAFEAVRFRPPPPTT